MKKIPEIESSILVCRLALYLINPNSLEDMFLKINFETMSSPLTLIENVA